MSRRGGAGLTRRGFGPRAPAGALSPADLAAQIIAVAAAEGITAIGWPIRGESDVTLVSVTHVAAVLHRGAGGSDAAQSADAARPTYSATAVNGLPGMTLDGGDALVTGAIDSGAATAYALLVLMSDSDTAARFPMSFGDITSGAGLAVKTNNAAGGIGAQALAGGATSRAESAASYPLASPALITATLDTGLSVDCTEIRHNGVNVTSTRPVNGNPTGSIGSAVATIGARQGPANNITGAIGDAWLLWHSGAWSGAKLTALAEIEALILAAKGL